mmetsp:Transcript_36881/g.118695  ORF Transcript_36881/g.118695 Transcript_36881/m.118695 type:complete len:124 (+) Transcript_36881:101-472(+)
MRFFTNALAVLLLLIAVAVAARFFKRRRAQQMKYRILSMYEDADKPFQPFDRLVESDELMRIRPCSSGLSDAEAVGESDALLVSRGTAPRPPKKREKTKELLGVDTNDVNAVQALIKQELEGV